MANFFDMRCPQCGDEDHIDIHAAVWLRVCDNGTDADASENGDHEFTPDSPALCAACGHCGTVREFEGGRQ
jgi:ribosomal protein S27E